MIRVYSESGDVVALVEYGNNLDFWDGSAWTCGSPGRHKGITKLKDGRYVLIHGTQWQGERDYAEVVSPSQALQEILHSGNDELLNEENFADLKQLMEETIAGEA